MENSLKGLICLIAGLAFWLGVSFVAVATGNVLIIEGIDGKTAYSPLMSLVYIGFFVMILGPLYFWIVAPLRAKKIRKILK